jgi:hypothetical protein
MTDLQQPIFYFVDEGDQVYFCILENKDAKRWPIKQDQIRRIVAEGAALLRRYD